MLYSIDKQHAAHTRLLDGLSLYPALSQRVHKLEWRDYCAENGGHHIPEPDAPDTNQVNIEELEWLQTGVPYGESVLSVPAWLSHLDCGGWAATFIGVPESSLPNLNFVMPGQERDGDLIYYYKRDDIALRIFEFKHVGVVQRTQDGIGIMSKLGPGTRYVFIHSIHDALPWYGYMYCIRRP